MSASARLAATPLNLKQSPEAPDYRPFESLWLGCLPYGEALNLQWNHCEQVRKNPVGRILGLEHRAVVTLGRRSDPEKDLKVSLKEFEKQNVEIITSERGGEATLHSPGQLVIYPLIPLKEWGLGVREFVALLEKTTLETLADLGVPARTLRDEPGLFTAQGKIAFFGLRIDRGISRHGLSLNVSNDLNLFSLIRSCGQAQERMDSLHQRGVNITLSEVFRLWIENFKRLT